MLTIASPVVSCFQQEKPSDYSSGDCFSCREARRFPSTKLYRLIAQTIPMMPRIVPTIPRWELGKSHTERIQTSEPEDRPAGRKEMNCEPGERRKILMVVDPAHGGDHRSTAGQSDGEIPIDPLPHRGENDSAECGYRNRQPAAARCW
jgi:hypothetical protein